MPFGQHLPMDIRRAIVGGTVRADTIVVPIGRGAISPRAAAATIPLVKTGPEC